jgi:hypothetical protein
MKYFRRILIALAIGIVITVFTSYIPSFTQDEANPDSNYKAVQYGVIFPTNCKEVENTASTSMLSVTNLCPHSQLLFYYAIIDIAIFSLISYVGLYFISKRKLFTKQHNPEKPKGE